ncbi:Na+/H+ antiporter [Niallia sp. FSL R7-0271]|uniref:Na+/H+ antiporter n=1 Tax=Niallia sp. FSL R7-0271 TaxID=2921678 RepID=UPI0030F608DB
MEILMTIILLLVCLIISNIISHYLPFIPTALTQITFGIALALLSNEFHLEIESEWFLLLFVAPLLYNDGRHFPRDELWKMRAPILGNAVVLVLLTTLGGGYFIHWLIPNIPIPAAFALAAILSPTDPVAVNGIAKRVRLPEAVLNLVRGESLINDASGLVAFNYAVAAVVTGYFSVKEAIYDFSYMFIIGAILGIVLSLLLTWIRYSLRKRGISDVTLHSLLQLMSPFLIYIITEECFHASGVIAVVVGGIVHSLLREKTERMQAEEQVLTENIWTTLSFILNGTVFLLLGLIIPNSIGSTIENPNIQTFLAVGYVLAIGGAILAIRFIWSYVFSYYEYWFKRRKIVDKPTVKMTLLISLTGVRGAVTMAGVLSIPLVTMSGEAFPERSLLLFIAAGVILFTLIVATIFLPLISREDIPDGKLSNYLDVNTAKNKLLLASLKQMRLQINEENETAAYQLMDDFKALFNQSDFEKGLTENSSTEFVQKVTEVRLMALKSEKKYIQDTRDKGEMNEELFELFMKILDLREEMLLQNVQSRFGLLIRNVFRDWKRSNSKRSKGGKDRLVQKQEGKQHLIKASQIALEQLEALANEYEEPSIIYTVIYDYRKIITANGTPKFNAKIEAQKEELRIMLMDVQRTEIRRMYQNGEISNEQTKDLRRMVNYFESAALIEHTE